MCIRDRSWRLLSFETGGFDVARGPHHQAGEKARQRPEPERGAVPLATAAEHAGDAEAGEDGAERPHGVDDGATGGAIVHAMGPLGAILAGLGITSVLGSGGQWHSAALWFGALPCFLSGLVMWAARHVEPTSLK